MMDADASNHKLGQKLDLRQVSVHFIKALNLLLDEFLDDTFCISISEINLGIKVFSILGGAGSAECEDNTR